VPPEKLFREYVYFSSFSDTALENAREIAEKMIASRQMNETCLAMEVASNDGYLLQYYRNAGVPVLGIEPATNIAKVATEKGIPTICEFFGAKLGSELAQSGRKADVLHANNVLAHVADLNGFVAGIAAVLKDNGVAIIEAPYVKELIERVEFDTIYHEHLCYFSLTALDQLFRRHGLLVVDVAQIPIHGGSLRVFVSKANAIPGPLAAQSLAVQNMLAEERELGIASLEYYHNFGERVASLRRDLLKLLSELKAQGKHIAAYGASAKGSTLLNYFGIGAETLDFVADRSTAKQGLYTPGTHLPIVAPESLMTSMPDYVLLLTWNFADEIMKQQAQYRQGGGKFILPIPTPTIV
jgi:SAM-dependent methyltransferase